MNTDTDYLDGDTINKINYNWSITRDPIKADMWLINRLVSADQKNKINELWFVKLLYPSQIFTSIDHYMHRRNKKFFDYSHVTGGGFFHISGDTVILDVHTPVCPIPSNIELLDAEVRYYSNPNNPGYEAIHKL